MNDLSYQDSLEYVESTIARHLRHGAKLTQQDIALAEALASFQVKLNNHDESLLDTEINLPPIEFHNAMHRVIKQFDQIFQRSPADTFSAPSTDVIYQVLTRCFKEHVDDLAKVVSINKIVLIPYVSVDLPVRMITLFHHMSDTSPAVVTCLNHPDYGPEFMKLAALCDRYALHCILCNLVYSTIERTFVFLGCGTIRLLPVCAQSDCYCFAPVHCSDCRTTAYCSEACQRKDWNSHKRACQKLAKIVEEFHVFDFQL